ncbi:hypothetical protein VSS98_08680 [Lactobacillus delbrueckii subsp. allosunkii]|uniref:MurR/RpiR family transcriptional regulator n=1 Tax=Lactobacillus delbrueckii TaxID=1584 RepID=UPI003A89F882
MAGLKARIVEKSSDLNPSDKKILNYLLNNAAECSELSLAKLAKKLYVSESAIFRLCKKVGLSGYSELKYELADFSKGEKRMVKQQDTFAERLVKNLRSELSYFRTLDFESFYSTLNQTENIYILHHRLAAGVYRQLSLQPAPGECGQADGCHAISD